MAAAPSVVSHSPAANASRRTIYPAFSGANLVSSYSKFRGEILRLQGRTAALASKIEELEAVNAPLAVSNFEPFVKIRHTAWPARAGVFRSLVADTSREESWANLGTSSKKLVKDIIWDSCGIVQYYDGVTDRPIETPTPPIVWSNLRHLGEFALELFDCTTKERFHKVYQSLVDRVRVCHALLDAVRRLVEAVSTLVVRSTGPAGSAVDDSDDGSHDC